MGEESEDFANSEIRGGMHRHEKIPINVRVLHQEEVRYVATGDEG